MDYLRNFQPTAKQFDHPSLFNQIVPNKRRDIIDNTTHTLDLKKQQQFELHDPIAFAQDPSKRDIYWALNQGSRTYNSIGGVGIAPGNVAAESALLRNPQQGHSIHNLNPQTPVFYTMPYLGRGSVDPTLERRITTGIYQPVHKRRTTLPETSTVYEEYLDTQRGIMNNGLVNEIYGRPNLPGVVEDQLGGLPQYGAHTRLAKYNRQR